MKTNPNDAAFARPVSDFIHSDGSRHAFIRILKGELKMETITINGEEYVKKQKIDSLKYVICRTYSAGVFAGYLESRNGQEVVLRNARRIWYWKGAASLSQLATDGTSFPSECKFPAPVDRVELLQAIEILDVTEKAKKSIESVKEWKM